MNGNIFLVIFSLFLSYNIAKNNYGQFNVAVTKFEVCKGPKSKDCVLTTAWITNRTRIYYNMNVLEKMAPTNGKILTTSNNNVTMRLHMNKPCDHLFIRPILHNILNVTKNCVILPGNYTFYLDFQDIFEKYYGGSFLYGSWSFKTVIYGSNCNFVCQVMEITITPKN